MVQVSGLLAFSALETTLKAILRAPDQKVTWPMNVRKFSLGGEAALLQILATWASEARKAVLHLPVQTLTETQIDNFVSHLYGLAASLLSDSVQDLSGKDYAALVQANGRVQLSRYLGPSYLNMLHEGEDAAMLCVDHIGRGHPHPVYYFGPREEPKVKNETEFVALTKKILEAITPKSRAGGISTLASAIGSMLHEIFENTDELDYSAAPNDSYNMARYARRLIENSDRPRGEAAAELLIALLTRRLRFHSTHYGDVLKPSKNLPPRVERLRQIAVIAFRKQGLVI